jgi:ATP-dependent RNA helicase RhlB
MLRHLNRFLRSAKRRFSRSAASPDASPVKEQESSATAAKADRKPAVEHTKEGGKSRQSAPRTGRGKRSSSRKKPAWSLADFPVDPIPGKARFHDFSIDLEVMRGIAAQGFEYCTPIQENALPAAIQGQDMIARAQTGTGKTAVFMVALLCQLAENKAKAPEPGHPRALIIAPTRELVVQIVKDGRKLAEYTPHTMAAVYGGTDSHKQKEILRAKPYDIIAATPGRLLDYVRQKVLVLKNCTCLVIDEADRMLDMGFIPDVRRIESHMAPREKRQTMLFSATVTDDVRRLASQWCRDPEYFEVGEESIDVPSIEQRIYLATEEQKFIMLYNLVKESQGARILVFENMKSDASRLVKRLTEHGIHCQLLTGDVPQTKRLARLEGFRAGKNRVLVATDVAGRGIHVDDIEYVVNYTLPYEPESYVHRIGRTGRAGARGVAISFACEKGSFNIPDIEEFIEHTLDCVVPDEALLKPVPPPTKAPETAKGSPQKSRKRRRPPSRRNRPRTR